MEIKDKAYLIAQYIDLDMLEEALAAAKLRDDGGDVSAEQIMVLSRAVKITTAFIEGTEIPDGKEHN